MPSASTSASDFRSHFPALQASTAFFENAGGTAVPRQVIRRMTDFLESCNVQLGADYPASRQATKIVSQAHTLLDRIFGGEGIGTSVIGASSSQLLAMLAGCFAQRLQPGDEVVIDETGHEANINPWLRLETQGVRIRWWRIDPQVGNTTLDGLRNVLSERTRLVVFPHVSNLLGAVNDVASIVELAHQAGAQVVVDGVAYAPHGPMDVAAWGCDFYGFSVYKVFGPHMAALFGRKEAWADLEGPNHFFIPRDQVPYKFELGCQNHEGCVGILGLGDYIRSSIGSDEAALPNRADIEEAWRRWQAVETPLAVRLVEGIASVPGVRIVGPGPGVGRRFGIVSFVHDRLGPETIVKHLVAHGVLCRSGHMYAYRLLEALGIPPEPGVVRVSLVHTNSIDDIERLHRALHELTASIASQ